MNRIVFATAFAMGLAAVGWVGVGFIGSSGLALVMTLVIAGVYLAGVWELHRFRAATAALASALANIPQPLNAIGDWLQGLPPTLHQAVRLRVAGERVALPGPALTPYLVGLLVMLGMLGTFLGMVVTFNGAVFALEGSTDMQAIRAALAAPIKGLGLSFGTSVAGVAASAMLGLLSAISRRERVAVARQLDGCIASVLRPFSLAHQRDESFKALQVQAQAMPEVVRSLASLTERIDSRHELLHAQLQAQQDAFHRQVSVAYSELARSVSVSLQDSLVAGAKAAGESIKPVVASAMSDMVAESTKMQSHLNGLAQSQLDAMSTQLSATVSQVSQGWHTALQQHAETLAQNQSTQAQADKERLDSWQQALQALSQGLQTQWQRVGETTLTQQEAMGQTLAQTVSAMVTQSQAQAQRTLEALTPLLAQSEALVRSRAATEEQWLHQHGERMDQLAKVWHQALQALREEESVRGAAAVARLGDLQSALATQLATLGTALEAPMTRLMQTATEVPVAAGELMGQLRQEMSRLTERDNQALEERAKLMGDISTLLHTVTQASSEQRASIESLLASAVTVLNQANSQFSATLEAQTTRAEGVAAQLGGSAVELSSLGAAFHHGVQAFSVSNDKLMDSLHRIEAALGQSMARSDEQLAYYVAQAREVIDLSITSQQGIVEDMRRLQSQQVATVEGVAG